jgi:hypothetical protein
MAQLIDIRRVEVGPKNLTARIRVAMSAPLMTSDDLEGTTRVYRLLPHIIDHVCLGDGGETFKDVMGDTEIAHLLEHVTVELLAQTDIAGDVPCGRTFTVTDELRTYDIELSCPDDVLVAGALSSAVWILQWAYSGGGDPVPDIDATVQGLVSLVQSLPEPAAPAPTVREYVVDEDEAEELRAGFDPATAPIEDDDLEGLGREALATRDGQRKRTTTARAVVRSERPVEREDAQDEQPVYQDEPAPIDEDDPFADVIPVDTVTQAGDYGEDY